MATDALDDPADAEELLPLGPPAVAILLHALLLVLYLLPWHYDLSAMVCVASDRQGRPGNEAISTPRGQGYDGQFYYLLAQQPPGFRLADRGDLDATGRQVRMLYPALGWFLSTGDPHALLFMLPVVNLLAIGLLAFAGALLARMRGLSPWWGVLLPFAVNAGLPLFRDLTDNLGLALVALLLVGWLRNWSAAALFWLGLAALLTRETTLPALAALGVVALWQRRGRVVLALTLAGFCWVGWVVYVGWLYGEWPLLAAAGNFGRPLAAFATAWQHSLGPTASRLDCVRLLLILVLPPLVLVALLWQRRIEPGLLLVAGAGTLLVLVAGQSIWEDFWSYARVLTLLPLATWLACIHGRQPRLAAILSLAGCISLEIVARGFLSGPI